MITLQSEHDGYWRKLGNDLTLFQMKVEAERGNIFTCDKEILATTIPTFELRMDLKADGLTDTLWKKNIDSLVMMLGWYIPEKTESGWRDYLVSERVKGSRNLLLAKGIDFQTFKKIREIPLFKKGKNKSGFITISSNTRKFPFGDLAKRTIGYINADGKAIGIEDMLNLDLAGENREILMKKVAGGVYMPVDENSEFGSKPGLDVYTTIDINLQDVAETSLRNSLEKFQAHHGSATLMNVKTGEIKAIANIGRKRDGTYGEIKNYAIGELNEPGSVMKLASVMALIDEGYCDENYLVDLENGSTKYYDRTMTDAEPISGKVTLTKAFEKSSNIGISKPVVKFFGSKKSEYYNILERFHLTKPYGIGIEGEGIPDLKQPENWDGTTLPWLSTGYEFRTTPLHILGLYAAVANNGKMMKPFLVKEVRDNDRVLRSFKPEVLNKQIVKLSTITAVRHMLESVVDSGTASNIRSKMYTIAGKTGTNKIADKNGYTDNYIGSFAGYFPANNPVYACIVVIYSPKNSIGYHGREVAAPVFREIADRIATTDKEIHLPLNSKSTNLGLASFIGVKNEVSRLAKYFNWKALENNNNQSEWVTAFASKDKLVMKPTFITGKNTMPNVKNMNLKDAVYLLESFGVKVTVIGRGKIKDQSIKAGEKIYKGTAVNIKLG